VVDLAFSGLGRSRCSIGRVDRGEPGDVAV